MKHKFWTVLLAFAAILCLCFALASCGGKGSGENSNTEQDSGSEEEPAEPLPHDHVYGADNLCTVCGDKWEYTEGLEFTPSADGQSFLVSGAGTAQGDIVIPFGYQGKFVTGIADSAFVNGTLTGVELPSSVTFIGKNAFFGSHLTYVTIPATVTVIGDSAFGSCVLLITVNIADLAAWCNIQFANGTANPLSQAQHLVVGGEEVTELVIPKGVTKVSDYAFYGCDFLESIVIPDSVTVLGTLVFGDFTVTIVIRFEGTVEQWQELIKGLQLWESGQGNPVDCENGSIDQNGTVTPPPGGQGGQGGGQGGEDTPGGEHTHTYSETWSYDENSHWHAATCHPTERTDEAPHTYENGVCTECHYEHQNHTYVEDGVCEVCGGKKPYTKSADGRKIYFGEYPQTEVTESGLKGFLGMEAGANPTSESAGKWTDYGYYIEGSVQSYMWYIDVEYQGSRYRGVYFTNYRPRETTCSSSADYSFQDDNGYDTNTVYWFKYEPIEWRILEQKDGTALLMANIVLDNQQYYHEDSGTRTIDGKTVYPNNYKESDIRAWLTETFYETAFDEYAQQIIEITEVNNSASSTGMSSNEYSCENTEDKVFLLSYREVMNTSYGFSDSTSSGTRMFKSTDYAKSQGVLVSLISGYRGYTQWWLRSPYYHDGDASHHVIIDGNCYNGGGVNYISGVVPALRIRL